MIKSKAVYMDNQSAIFFAFVSTVGDLMATAEFEAWNADRIRTNYADIFQQFCDKLMALDSNIDQKLIDLLSSNDAVTKSLRLSKKWQFNSVRIQKDI